MSAVQQSAALGRSVAGTMRINASKCLGVEVSKRHSLGKTSTNCRQVRSGSFFGTDSRGWTMYANRPRENAGRGDSKEVSGSRLVPITAWKMAPVTASEDAAAPVVVPTNSLTHFVVSRLSITLA